jgi:hypothetical protein
MSMIYLKTGDILHTHTPFTIKRPLTIIAAAIRWATKSYWNHTAVVVRIWGKVFIMESEIHGVQRPIPLEEWVGNKTVSITRSYEESEREYALKAISKIGKAKYDFASLFWFHPIEILFGRYYGYTSERKAAKRFYCSEYAAWLRNYPDWFKMKPIDLYEYELKVGALLLADKIKASSLL